MNETKYNPTKSLSSFLIVLLFFYCSFEYFFFLMFSVKKLYKNSFIIYIILYIVFYILWFRCGNEVGRMRPTLPDDGFFGTYVPTRFVCDRAGRSEHGLQ